jgi:biotin carboxyl carrier protein
MMIVEIKGHRYEVTLPEWESLDCQPIGENEYHLIEKGKSHLLKVIQFDLASRQCTLMIDGELVEATMIRDLDLLIEQMGLNIASSTIMTTLHAPMPGLVTGIKAEAGQQVEKGTPLLILEAMKMENVITAPHDAIIREITVSLGQAVDKGAVLIEFEK